MLHLMLTDMDPSRGQFEGEIALQASGQYVRVSCNPAISSLVITAIMP